MSEKKYIAKKEEFEFNFKPPSSENLLRIYEIFLEVQETKPNGKIYEPNDLSKFPAKEWYEKISNQISVIGFEKYRNHVKETLERIIILQSAHNRVEQVEKKDRKKGKYLNRSDYIENYHSIRYGHEAPSHFYFYCTDKGRYLKGLILSISCMSDPILLKLIEKFAFVFPFQVGNISQAPTGLFVYDVLEVFSKLKYPDSIPYILNLKAKIKQTWAQKRFDRHLKKIAKKNKVEEDKVIELGISDYGFNTQNVYERNLGEYKLQLSFPAWKKKKAIWLNSQTGKKQKAVPKEIRDEHPEALKYIKTHIKDIESQLSAQSQRIEKSFLNDTVWDIKYWKERYFDHPFISNISKNLIWLFSKDNKKEVAIYDGENILNEKGASLDLNEFKFVQLWHPIHSTEKIDTIKNKINSLKITQPFKQAEREYYQIDFVEKSIGAKMKKSTLSQLCKNRGWTSSANHSIKIPPLNLIAKLILSDNSDGTRGMFDGSENVEFKGVEFFIEKKEIEIEAINPVTFSEIARDIDLFINVAKSK